MSLSRTLLGEVRGLDEFDLRRLAMFVGELLGSRLGGAEATSDPPPVRRESYRQQLVRCGKPGCTRCPHGPYWYAFWREGGRVRSRYVGKEPLVRPPG
jgi:hypothetical protein